MGFVSRFIYPEVDRRLLTDEGEYIIDEVMKHWVTYVIPCGAMALSGGFFVTMAGWGRFWMLPLVLGLALFVWGLMHAHEQHMDRFVITNMRVFRVHGVLSQHLATMPMTRILDISVYQPLLGRLLNYGHFVFESAAQDQGLRDIRFVGHPEERDLTIQKVIQKAGLRSNVSRSDMVTDDENENDGV